MWLTFIFVVAVVSALNMLHVDHSKIQRTNMLSMRIWIPKGGGGRLYLYPEKLIKSRLKKKDTLFLF